ncbi:MAG: glycosyltransferase family 2 protein [Leclercia sp.]
MKVLILGTSNSILKNGWSYGLRDALKGHEVVSMSVGASPGIQFAEKMSMDFTQYDHVFFDSIPNDEEYAFKAKGYSSTERNERVMYEIFSTIASQTSLIVLGFTNSWCFDEESTIYASRKELAHQVGAQFIDIRKILTIFLDGNSIESIYEPHPAHPKREFSYKIGEAIGSALQSFVFNRSVNCVNYKENFIADEVWASYEQAKVFSNSLLKMNVIPEKNGFTLKTQESHACLGFYVNSYSTHCNMFYSERNGTRHSLRLIYKQNREDGKFLKVFVPLQDSPRISNITIGGHLNEECNSFFPVMTYHDSNPLQEIHLSSLLYWDDYSLGENVETYKNSDSDFLHLNNIIAQDVSLRFSQIKVVKSKITHISDAVNRYFANSKTGNYITKSWNYKDTCFVVDFSYRGVNFAIDFFPETDALVKASIIIRKDSRKVINIDGIELEGIAKPISITACLPEVMKKVEHIMSDIDTNASVDITVIVPVYNRENLILGCIDSINNQTLDKKRFEVIFIDDNSSDKSVTAIDYTIGKDVNHRIIKRPVGSGNASAPRNEGIKIAKGNYIFFMDSDDKISETLLEDAIDCAEKNDSDVIYFKITADAGIGAPIRPFKKGDVYNADITKNHLMRSLAVYKLFRASLLKYNNILFNPSIAVAEDKLFMCQVHAVANKVSILANKGYYHRCNHEGDSEDGHLSKRGMSIEDKYKVFSSGLSAILFSRKNNIETSKLYNAWLILCTEMMVSTFKNKSINNEDKNHLFSVLSNQFTSAKHLFDQRLIYENEKNLASAIVVADLKKFISFL